MTGCVSYFAASLNSLRTLGQAPFQDSQESYLTTLGLCFVRRVDSSFFLDLQFRHAVFAWVVSFAAVFWLVRTAPKVTNIWLNRCQYWKLLLVFFQRVKKGQSKHPPATRDIRSIGHFQHSRKTLLFSWSKRASQEIWSKNCKASPKSAAKQKIILYRPSSS